MSDEEEIPPPHERLAKQLEVYQSMVVRGDDPDTLAKVREVLFRLTLLMIRDAPVYWSKLELRSLAKDVLEGVDNVESQRNAAQEAAEETP